MPINNTLLTDLGTLANQVYNETQISANTHTRVGKAFQDTHDLFELLALGCTLMPIGAILTDEVSIVQASVSGTGDVVWCAKNGSFAMRIASSSGSLTTYTYYNNWNAYGAYPSRSVYDELLEGDFDTQSLLAYVKEEQAFYYWDGSTFKLWACAADVAVAQDFDYMLGIKDGKMVMIKANAFIVQEEKG